ncbi:hypothetical protein D3C86_845200 [compost metagenome]
MSPLPPFAPGAFSVRPIEATSDPPAPPKGFPPELFRDPPAPPTAKMKASYP